MQNWKTLLLLPLVATSTLAQSLNLTDFQKITGFSSECTKAYNTPLPGCTTNDFAGNNPCSQTCVDGLESLTSLINAACAGISTSPSTLIGLFFAGRGVQALCPNAVQQSSSTAPQQISSAPAATSNVPLNPPQTPTTNQPSPPASSSTLARPSTSATFKQTSSARVVTANPSQPSRSSNPPSSARASAISPLPTFILSSPATTTAAVHPQTTSNGFGGSIDPFGGSASAASTSGLDGILMVCLLGGSLAFYLVL
ncbi:MAG: hypothetical protein LQ340_006967 [Diploschistes diacapsis]|nr:MAG: hypothetical protein LQ340_006967 [Diploschistes diacapsis]